MLAEIFDFYCLFFLILYFDFFISFFLPKISDGPCNVEKNITSSTFSVGLDVMVALLTGLKNQPQILSGDRKETFFFYIKDPSRSADLSQCDCKYHFYGIKFKIWKSS